MFAENSKLKTPASNRQHTMELIEKIAGQHTFVGLSRVLIDFMEGDFVAAAVLNQILYWSDRTNDPQGYFWKSYKQWKDELGFGKSRVMRVIYGDSRTKSVKKTLLDVGVEVIHRKAPNGLRINHYRINQPLFFALLVDFLETHYGVQQQENDIQEIIDNPDMISSTEHIADEYSPVCEDNNNDLNADLGETAMQTWESPHCQLSTLTENTNPDNTSSIEDLMRERELGFLTPYQKIFGKLNKRLLKKLGKQVDLLGKKQTIQVIQRCKEYGHSWQYVLKALRNEQSLMELHEVDNTTEKIPANIGEQDTNLEEGIWEETGPPSPIINERINRLKPLGDDTASQLWLHTRLSLYHHPNYRNVGWRFDSLRLVDYCIEKQQFILVAIDKIDRDFCQKHELLAKVIYDSCRENIDFTVYTVQEWNEMQQV